ncbi:MAG: flagellar basal body protein, partial [Candidatus Wallbacteria bacterium]|nr:flagellar basal body protein [Candidatus Wallbacteria bacterium]
MINFYLDQIFGDDTQVVLEKGLDVAALRHQVITQNIANVNTPGYKLKDVSFEDQLNRSL